MTTQHTPASHDQHDPLPAWDADPVSNPNAPLTPEQRERFNAWQVEAMTTMPYYAPVILSLIPLSSTWVATAAVDTWHRVYLNFEYMDSLSSSHAGQVLLHECSHLIQDHHGLADAVGQVDLQSWNLAADAAINGPLLEAGCDAVKELGLVLPEHLGMDPGGSVFDYYPALADMHAAADGQDEDWTLFPGCGSGAGQPGPHELDQDTTLPGVPEPIGEVGSDLIRRATADAIAQHVASRGRVPRGVEALVESVYTAPPIHWRIELAGIPATIRGLSGSSRPDYSRPSRRPGQRLSSGTRVLNPSRRGVRYRLHAHRDVSASVEDRMIVQANNAVESLARSLRVRPNDLIVTDVDTEVHASFGYAGFRDLHWVSARGGTDMRRAIEFSLQAQDQPDVVLIITDGLTPWPEQDPGIPVFVLLYTQHRGQSEDMGLPSWAKVIEIPARVGAW